MRWFNGPAGARWAALLYGLYLVRPVI